MKTFPAPTSNTQRGPAEWFSGEVWVQPLLGPNESPTQRSAIVSFASGVRTAWHTHPLGQMIYIVSGICHAQREGGPIEQLNAGDAAWFAPHEKHWHGSAPGHPMAHLAVQQADENGQTVTWLEHVERAE